MEANLGGVGVSIGSGPGLQPQFADDLKELLSRGVQVVLRNDGHHWVISKGNLRIDYWPSREKFQITTKSEIMQGFKGVIEAIEKRKE